MNSSAAAASAVAEAAAPRRRSSREREQSRRAVDGGTISARAEFVAVVLLGRAAPGSLDSASGHRGGETEQVSSRCDSVPRLKRDLWVRRTGWVGAPRSRPIGASTTVGLRPQTVFVRSRSPSGQLTVDLLASLTQRTHL